MQLRRALGGSLAVLVLMVAVVGLFVLVGPRTGMTGMAGPASGASPAARLQAPRGVKSRRGAPGPKRPARA